MMTPPSLPKVTKKMVFGRTSVRKALKDMNLKSYKVHQVPLITAAAKENRLGRAKKLLNRL